MKKRMLLKLEEEDENEGQYPKKTRDDHMDSERIFTEPLGEFLSFYLQDKNQRFDRYRKKNRNKSENEYN